MMAGRPYTTKEYIAIIQMWKDGKSAQEIADKFGRTKNAIKTILSVHRTEEEPTMRKGCKRENSWKTSVCKQLAEMWKQGATLEEIAAAFDVSVSTIKSRVTLIRMQYGKEFLPYRREFHNGR